MQLEVAAGMRYQTKQDLVYSTLRNAIMHCTLAPGQRLVIEEIANQLAVSPIPVREALHLLQSERLVETVPHVGATVARISRSGIVEVFTVMEGLEIVGTRSATQRLTPQHLAQLGNLLDEMDTALRLGQLEHWADLNSQLHRTIGRITAMPMLQEMTDRVFDQWDRLRRYFFNGVLRHRTEQAQQQHHAIVEAMRAKNYECLEQLVKQHNQEALAAYTEYVAQKGET
jgi:DNA-binding GntR family transcriptional regulator